MDEIIPRLAMLWMEGTDAFFSLFFYLRSKTFIFLPFLFKQTIVHIFASLYDFSLLLSLPLIASSN